MPLALTVFGVAAHGRDPVLCYAFLRDARGMGDYPKPHLPKAAAPAGTTRLPLGLFEGLDVLSGTACSMMARLSPSKPIWRRDALSFRRIAPFPFSTGLEPRNNE
jgi:hypothetical protein